MLAAFTFAAYAFGALCSVATVGIAFSVMDELARIIDRHNRKG